MVSRRESAPYRGGDVTRDECVFFVTRRAGISPSQLSAWKRLTVEADEDVVDASQVRDLEKLVSELARLLGRKTMENEILKEALALARPSN